MKTILFISNLLFIWFMVSCSPNQPVPSKPGGVERTDEVYDRKMDRDRNRDEVIRRTRERFTGEACEDVRDSRQKDDCEDLCQEMYKRRRAKQECEELPVRQIEALHEMYEILEDADDDDLDGIDPNDFDVFLNISIEGFDELIEDYSSSKAENVLLWMINDSEIARIFESEDDEFDSLEELLQQFESSYRDSNSIHEAFTSNADGDELMEVIVQDADEEVHDWFLDFINEKNTACEDDPETRACFRVYCRIGDDLTDDAREDWLDFEEFEDYLENIIDERVNSRQGEGSNRNNLGWIHEDRAGNDPNEIGDVGDLDDWVDDLCHGLRT